MLRTLILGLFFVSSAIGAGAQQRSASITAIMPTFGHPGTTVTIRGAGFSGFESGTWAKELTSEPAPGAVEFNGVPGEIVFWQDNLITVKVPIGASTGPIRVINPGARVQLIGASFEVPFSEGAGRASSTGETSRHPTPKGGNESENNNLDDSTGSDGSAQAFITRGNTYYQRRDYRSAINQYDRALAVSGNSVDALEARSLSYSRLGMYDEAISTTNRILTVAPRNPRAYVSLCWYYSLSDQHQASADAGRLAVKYAPENYAGYTNLCRAYNDLGRFQEAVTTCARALEIKPGDGETYFNRGRAYKGLKQPARTAPLFEKAVAGLLRYVRENPEDADGHYLLANAYTETKQDESDARVPESHRSQAAISASPL